MLFRSFVIEKYESIKDEDTESMKMLKKKQQKKPENTCKGDKVHQFR